MNKSLILFRLFNRTYGPGGNPKTLSVYLKPDNTFGYSFYGGWQNSGTGFAISNLQMTEWELETSRPLRRSGIKSSPASEPDVVQTTSRKLKF